MWLIYNMVTDYFYNKIPDTDTDIDIDTDTDQNHLCLINTGTQTDICLCNYTSFTNSNSDEINLNNNNFFKHLAFANQDYFEHFGDSIKYCGTSLKGAFYFFCHAVWPDIFQQNGSETIHQLSSTISDKYKKRMEELANN